MISTLAKGFTLLELVITLAIIALLLALVMPSGARQRERVELASSAREVAAALRLTRSRAILADRPAVFVVDLRRALYRAAGAKAAKPFPRGIELALVTTQEEELSPAIGTIRFYPDGSSTGGGLVLSRGNGRYDILVDWLTGGVSIHARRQAAR